MTRTILSGLAAFAALTLLAGVPADAQKFRQDGGAHMNNSAGTGNVGTRGKRSGPRGSRKLSNGQQQPSANAGASLHGLSVYLQWRAQCLNNLLPECK